MLLFLPVKIFYYLCGKWQVKGGENEEWDARERERAAINTHTV